MTSPAIAELLADHLREMDQHSPPESVHALDLDNLRHREITSWSIWYGAELVKSTWLELTEVLAFRAPSRRTRMS